MADFFALNEVIHIHTLCYTNDDVAHYVLCPWARHINPSLALVQPRKTRPYITEKMLTGT